MTSQDSIGTADAPTSTNENDVSESSSRYKLTVSNGPRGHLARIRCVAFFPVSPETIYAVLTNPDNTGVFRDVLDSTRKVSTEEDRLRVVEVEQTGRVRLPFGEVKFKTRLRVTEDARERPARWTTRFELLGSDVLSTFDGTWTLEPNEEGGGRGDEGDDGEKRTTTVATLEQDVTPRGVPRWLKFVPFVGGGVKGACARAVRRMVEDLASVADAVAARVERGESGELAVEGVLRECHERAAREEGEEGEAVAADGAAAAVG